MTQIRMFLIGCLIVCLITFVVNLILKNNPKKADTVINYIIFFLLGSLLTYGIAVTDWKPVEERLSKDLKDYRETQRNVWK